MPRTPRKVFKPLKRKKTKEIWSFEISLFKDYQVDTPQLLDNCFEFDWNNSKVKGVVKNKEHTQPIKQLLRDFYLHIKEFYKFYSSQGTGGIWSISSNLMLEIVNNTGLIDGKTLTQADYDIIFTSVSNDKKFKNDQKSFIVRHKFLELICRVINKKYKENQGMGPVEAMEHGLDTNIKPLFGKFNSQLFRATLYWNE